MNLLQSDRIFIKSHTHLECQAGIIAVANFAENIPQGWERLSYEEGVQMRQRLESILTEWSIVAFQTGCLMGPGYHYALRDSYDTNCGEGFIIKRRI